ncbi:MAG: hypothetical protein IIU02_10125, partial [Treponema sp.]|uniref:hypothetical protein n=1 Tax=Treponema sp. TaxID=166 RepID=UPI00257F60C3
ARPVNPLGIFSGAFFFRGGCFWGCVRYRAEKTDSRLFSGFKALSQAEKLPVILLKKRLI